ncbi:MAG: hypothetical protein IJD52_03350 [Alphaproteobacteria bacterium]|nr:hypothetical protein [Alphaproteobacteria bacterium]
MKTTIKKLIPFVCAVASAACATVKENTIYSEQYDLPDDNTYYVQNIWYQSNNNKILMHLIDQNKQSNIWTIPNKSVSRDIFYAQPNDTIVVKQNKPINISLQNRMSQKVR